MGVLIDSVLRSAEERVSYTIMEERAISSFQFVSAWRCHCECIDLLGNIAGHGGKGVLM